MFVSVPLEQVFPESAGLISSRALQPRELKRTGTFDCFQYPDIGRLCPTCTEALTHSHPEALLVGSAANIGDVRLAHRALVGLSSTNRKDTQRQGQTRDLPASRRA